ncbi:MAG: CAP domain-containing protein [Nitratireductor sp.]|nr:CAP domain-containing protein [Nitratireductor sp.]
MFVLRTSPEPVGDRRHFLSGLSMAVCGAVLSGCAGIGRQASSTHAGRKPAAPGVKPLDFDPAAGLAEINETRAKFALPGFQPDLRLQRAAQTHADYMAKTGKFGHEFGPSTKFPVRMAAAGFEGSAGENLGVGYGSMADAIEGWLNSPKHREILLRPRYNLAGIAYAFNVSGNNPRFTHFWVLELGQDVDRSSMRGAYLRRL